jgi:hypothetical protein
MRTILALDPFGDGLRWLESLEQCLRKGVAEVLRLRAIEPLVRDRSSRRFAQSV